MNSSFSLLPNGSDGSAAQPELRRQAAGWRRLLEDCARKPSRRRVHGLRVATLRLQAEMEHWLQIHGPEDEPARAVRRWNRQAEKLRRVLSTVRETDVYLGKLDGLRGSVAGPEVSPCRLTRICLRQIALVERRFEKVRKSAAKKLAGEINDRRVRLDRLSKELESALAQAAPLAAIPGTSGVCALIAGLAAEYPELNAGNLHEYRKGIKKVRYVAEVSAAGDAEAGRQVAALRRMQSAVGNWHDWQALAKKAARALRGRDKTGSLSELLETLAEESLQKALEVCRSTTARLLNEGTGSGVAPHSLPPKLPVRRDEAVVLPDQNRYA